MPQNHSTLLDYMRSTIQTIWQSVSLPNVREQLTKMGFEIVANTPEQFAVFLRGENVKWGKVVKDLGLRAE